MAPYLVYAEFYKRFILPQNGTSKYLKYDSARKCIDMVMKLQKKHKLPGWRKITDWYSKLKKQMRALGRACACRGKRKSERVLKTAKNYVEKAKNFYTKLEKAKSSFPQTEVADMGIIMELEGFMKLLRKHIDLVERRGAKN